MSRIEGAEVAEHVPRLLSIGLSRCTVRQMVEYRKLPIVVLNGRTVRLRLEDIRALGQPGYLPAKSE